MNIQDLLKFTSFTHKFQQVIRQIYATKQDRDENDLEHMGQTALLGWYIISAKNLNLSLEKVLQYTLAHDLVEVYAGDTYFHTTDQKLKDSKEERERLAAERIKEEFPEFPELYAFINDYEARVDAEAKFVYALDKMIPVLNIYLDKGRSWKRDKVTYTMIKTKDLKITVSPEIEVLWNELKLILDKEELDLFPQDTN